MNAAPRFPPHLTGLATGPANPFAVACDKARRGVDAGLLAWSVGPERLRAALVLAPETALEPAMAGFVACGLGLQNALGALAPPETAVHLEWSGGVRLNGGHAGGLHMAASTRDPRATPDWLVVGLDLTLALPADFEPGETPDWTALAAEGCADIEPVDLLEAWARHSLVRISDLDSPGARAGLHRDWQGLLWNLGKTVSVPVGTSRHEGKFLGCDEAFGMIFSLTAGGTRLVPLSDLLEDG
jgi:hypothetical protein